MSRFAALARILVLILLLAALLGAVVIWLSLPRVLAVLPADAAADVPAGEPLTLQFSRPMQPDTVEARLEIEPAVDGQFSWQGNTLVFTPSTRWPAGETVRVQLQAGARAQGLLSLPLQSGMEWSFAVRQPRLVFLFPSNGPANLYVRDPVASVNQALTTLPGGVQDYAIVPGGRSIVFSLQSTQGGSDLYMLDLTAASESPSAGAQPAQTTVDAGAPAASGEPQRLLACAPSACRLPVVSPDGTMLAFERSEPPSVGQTSRPQVWVAPLASPQAAAPITEPTRSATLPAWSPYGDLTYFDEQAQAYILIGPNGAEKARYSNETGQPGSWRPTGQGFVAPEIGFLDANISGALQDVGRLANSHLLFYPWPQADRIDLSQDESVEDSVPAFSPDGKQLAFARKYLDTRRWSLGRQMWLMDIDTRQARALTDEPSYNHFDFAWSPDGRRLAYVRFNQDALTEAPEIWILDVQTSDRTQHIAGGYSPQWIP